MINDTIDIAEFCRGPVATMLVQAVRTKLQAQPRRRIIAVGRCVNGGAFKVTAPVQPPADFEQAIDEVLTPDRVQTVTMNHDVIENEIIGDEFSRQPWAW